MLFVVGSISIPVGPEPFVVIITSEFGESLVMERSGSDPVRIPVSSRSATIPDATQVQ